tara:strand:- start:229 stop:414 length:186 start_codon:yes stop_codon:yes gene_type:complete
MNTKWFKTLSIKELSTWVKHFDNSNSMLNELFPNRPNVDDIKEAKRILKNKREIYYNYNWD